MASWLGPTRNHLFFLRHARERLIVFPRGQILWQPLFIIFVAYTVSVWKTVLTWLDNVEQIQTCICPSCHSVQRGGYYCCGCKDMGYTIRLRQVRHRYRLNEATWRPFQRFSHLAQLCSNCSNPNFWLFHKKARMAFARGLGSQSKADIAAAIVKINFGPKLTDACLLAWPWLGLGSGHCPFLFFTRACLPRPVFYIRIEQVLWLSSVFPLSLAAPLQLSQHVGGPFFASGFFVWNRGWPGYDFGSDWW